MSDSSESSTARAATSIRTRQWLRRPSFRSLFVLLLLIATAYLVYDRLIVRAMMQWELLSAERAMIGHVEGPDEVVYEGNEVRAKALTGQAGWFVSPGASSVLGNEYPLKPGAVPAAGNAVRSRVRTAIDRFKSACRKIADFNELREMPRGYGGGLFGALLRNRVLTVMTIRHYEVSSFDPIHRAAYTSAVCTKRLVDIRVGVDASKSVCFQSEVFRMPQFFDIGLESVGPSEPFATLTQSNVTRELVLLPDDPKKGVRLYAPQPDPQDASRFTFDYEVNGLRGTIEGKLQADDTIAWQVLSGPAADPNWHADLLHPVP